MLEMRPGRHSGIMTLVMIWKGVAPMLWAASTTPSSSSRRLVSTRRATKGKAATTSGTMVALVPTVVPTMARVSGKTQIIKIRNGTQDAVLIASHQQNAQRQAQNQRKCRGEDGHVERLPNGEAIICKAHSPVTSSTVTPFWLRI